MTEKLIGETIRSFRIAKDISLQELEKRTGIKEALWLEIEEGEIEISIDQLYRIAEALEVQAASLLPNSGVGAMMQELRQHKARMLSCDLNVLLTGKDTAKVISLSELKRMGYTLIVID